MLQLRTCLALKLIVLILILGISTSHAAVIRELIGVVAKVSDGDTIQVVEQSGTKVKVRLYGIDAPETEKVNKRTGHISKPGQPYGEEAWRALEGKVLGRQVRLEMKAVDRYKRLVSSVWLGSRSINVEMVAEGWAWAYRQYLDRPHASEYLRLEDEARAKRLGLWQQHNPQPPWEFRRTHKVNGRAGKRL